jgi:hypothetical protein
MQIFFLFVLTCSSTDRQVALNLDTEMVSMFIPLY